MKILTVRENQHSICANFEVVDALNCFRIRYPSWIKMLKNQRRIRLRGDDGRSQRSREFR